MNYLFIEGYQEAAEKFAEESRLETTLNLSSLSDRTACRVAIQNGQVQEAIEKANDLDPLILDQCPKLYFHLQQQKLIELVREEKIEEAIAFAQNEMAPLGEDHVRFRGVFLCRDCRFREKRVSNLLFVFCVCVWLGQP